MAGREEVDVWSAMLGELSRASPEGFLDAIEDGRLSDVDTLIVVCLHAIDHPRATAILTRAVGCRDWLVRYHAVRALAGRDSDEARAALVRALDDPKEMIRAEARRAMRRTR